MYLSNQLSDCLNRDSFQSVKQYSFPSISKISKPMKLFPISYSVVVFTKSLEHDLAFPLLLISNAKYEVCGSHFLREQIHFPRLFLKNELSDLEIQILSSSQF